MSGVQGSGVDGSGRLLLTVVLFCWLLNAALVASLSADGLALLEFKKAITDDPFNYLGDWNEADALPCEWTGITCSGDEVTVIDLRTSNLTGSVPESIGQIKSLLNISLADNFLSGPIPSSIFTVTSLRFLDLQTNHLNSTIPSGFSKMLNLEYLDLSYNELSGSIDPDDFANQTAIRYLDLSCNEFSSQPFPSGIASLASLEHLDLSSCSLDGEIPSGLSNLKKLQELYLQLNQLTNIPPSFGDLDSLRILDISSNMLTGSIPTQLGNMKSIGTLRLYNNQLTGGIPKELSKTAATLVNLDVGINNMSGPIPPELASLTRLILLHVHRNQLNGSLPDRLFAKMTVLEDVFLYENAFTGELPKDLGQVQPFVLFDCAYNSFSGPIPPYFCKGGNQLQKLVLMNNNFSGQIPDTLLECPALHRVRLSNNRLTGPIPESFGKSQNILFLDLMNNNLSGTIPAVLGNCSNLTSLFVSGNKLTGPIPSTLINLQELEAANNNLTESFQAELCSKSMDRLDLSYNDFSGHLPLNLNICERLSFLYLQHNRITGVIPPSIAFMTEVNLSHNEISGPLPEELASSKTLETLDVSYNKLQGSVSLTGFMMTLNSSDFEGNPNLCGMGDPSVVEEILTPCELQAAEKSKKDGKPIKGAALALLIVGGVLTPVICWLAVCLGIRSKLYQQHRSRREAHDWSIIMFQKLPDLTVEDVLDALDDENVVGSGGSGKVYRGELRVGKSFRGKTRTEEQRFVVKKFNTPVERGCHLYDHGFRAEVETLGNIRHSNVVKLLACCSTSETKLLVYEYMQNGSLADQLHGSKGGMLDWDTRYKIALGAAQGLMYLHHDCVPPILHRDVSSSNILLDGDFNARVADFGLAKLVEETQRMGTVSILVGSHGYIAPECAFAPKANKKTDVYSYGVVLLELVTGRRAVEGDSGDGEHVSMWVQWKIREKDGLIGALDSRLVEVSTSDQEEMIMLLRIGLYCTAINPDKRPSMIEVVPMLIDVRNSARIPMQGWDGKNKKSSRIAFDEILPPITIPQPQPPSTPKSPPPLITL